jgi:hypothetical protein
MILEKGQRENTIIQSEKVSSTSSFRTEMSLTFFKPFLGRPFAQSNEKGRKEIAFLSMAVIPTLKLLAPSAPSEAATLFSKVSVIG